MGFGVREIASSTELMAHVMAPDDPDPFASPRRMTIAGRPQEQGRGVDGAARGDHDIGGECDRLPGVLHDDAVISRPLALVSSLRAFALVISVTFGHFSAGSTQTTWASLLALTRQGNPSQVLQRRHAALARTRLVQHDAEGHVKRVQPDRARSSCSF